MITMNDNNWNLVFSVLYITCVMFYKVTREPMCIFTYVQMRQIFKFRFCIEIFEIRYSCFYYISIWMYIVSKSKMIAIWSLIWEKLSFIFVSFVHSVSFAHRLPCINCYQVSNLATSTKSKGYRMCPPSSIMWLLIVVRRLVFLSR